MMLNNLAIDIKSWIKAVFALQMLIAALTVATTLSQTIDWGQGSESPPIYAPLNPGDQVRRFDPSKLPELTPETADTDQALPNRSPRTTPDRLYTDRLKFTPSLDQTHGKTLLVKGDFEQGDAERFERFLDGSSRKFKTISFDSPGGIVVEALKIAKIINKRELNTLVEAGALCASSCPFSFAGGKERLASKASYIGVHQAFFDEPSLIPVFFAVEDIQKLQGDVLHLLISFGVNPWIMVPALKTPKEDIYFFIEDELIENKLATKMVK
tara:strand:- start:292 stop:1098 length:807 start_codon:yes stop_codon:yes gene_type:complete